MPTKQELAVFASLDGQFVPAGLLTLTEENDRLLASEYAYGRRYIDRPGALEVDPVSLSLKDKESIRGKKSFPDKGLPFFGGIRDAAPDAWGRRVIEAKRKAPANGLPESVYLLEAGSERVGALDVRADIKSDAHNGHVPMSELQYLLEAAERIEAGLPIPAHLETIFHGGSALGGARPKAGVRDEQGVLWLAKFPSKDEHLNVPEIEAATLQLAQRCGMTVPEVRTLSVGERRVMLIRRFDRIWAAPGIYPEPHMLFAATAPSEGMIEKRLGFISGLTLLACDETSARSQSYGLLAQAIRRYCHPDLIRENNRELFLRMVYNIFVSNDDDHLRNHGFLWDPTLMGWRLSPLYDVMPRPSAAYERFLFLGVGPQGRQAHLDNAMAAREMFSLSVRDAAALIAQVWQEVREWKVHFESFGASGQAMEQSASAFRHIDDVSSAQLRAKLP
ncbi:type II toxin-antitoxin system HipA family toxin [Noviherbaspirillum sp.]|uniref:type II toxin-antitoxin system HipA family toxin n=1 Tax=Noviherbaspirillum sp. TaxID=1926288 RepID=UPI002FE1F579